MNLSSGKWSGGVAASIVVEVLLEDLSVEVSDAELIVSGLDTANRNYAAANEASHDAYRQVMGTVDAVLAHQGRLRKLPERAGGV